MSEGPTPSLHRAWIEIDHPALRHNLAVLRRVFPDLHVRGYQLFSMVRRVLRPGRLTALLERCDGWLLEHCPPLRRFCRYVVLTFRR